MTEEAVTRLAAVMIALIGLALAAAWVFYGPGVGLAFATTYYVAPVFGLLPPNKGGPRTA